MPFSLHFADTPYLAIRDIVIPIISFGLDCLLALHLHSGWETNRDKRYDVECGQGDNKFLSSYYSHRKNWYRRWPCNTLSTAFIMNSMVMISLMLHCIVIVVATFEWGRKRALRWPLKTILYNAVIAAVIIYGFLYSDEGLEAGLIYLTIRVVLYLFYHSITGVWRLRKQYLRRKADKASNDPVENGELLN
ncbi:hypothetical protein L596_009777 [Steinernema carpocapsae]|nr:hypothetical protein L596_009777 [Steinernema carpocapsae]